MSRRIRLICFLLSSLPLCAIAQRASNLSAESVDPSQKVLLLHDSLGKIRPFTFNPVWREVIPTASYGRLLLIRSELESVSQRFNQYIDQIKTATNIARDNDSALNSLSAADLTHFRVVEAQLPLDRLLQAQLRDDTSRVAEELETFANIQNGLVKASTEVALTDLLFERKRIPGYLETSNRERKTVRNNLKSFRSRLDPEFWGDTKRLVIEKAKTMKDYEFEKRILQTFEEIENNK